MNNEELEVAAKKLWEGDNSVNGDDNPRKIYTTGVKRGYQLANMDFESVNLQNDITIEGLKKQIQTLSEQVYHQQKQLNEYKTKIENTFKEK